MTTRRIAGRTGHATAAALLTALALLGLGWLWSAPAAKAAPPEQGKIAFSRGGDIWVMNADGSGQALLAERGGSPAWSPDGQRIAFARSRPGQEDAPPLTDIWVMNADGSGETNLTLNPDHPRYADRSPTWSPDGQRIAFDSNRDWTTLGFLDGAGSALISFYSQLWAMNADGSDRARLTEGTSPLRRDPAWSPDGEKIAYSRGGNIAVMNPDGSGERGFRSRGSHPAWSPDGLRIAFTHSVDEGPPGFSEFVDHVSVMNADGSDVTPLIRRARSPTWSPDGQRIAFVLEERAFTPTRETEVNHHIWAMNADGSCLTNLTRSPEREFAPAWQPLSPPSEPQECFTLSVSVSDPRPAGIVGGVSALAISCGRGNEECAASFAAGTELTLRASPWFRLVGWEGACTGTGPCALTMDADREVTASFGAAQLRARARPRHRRVGPNKRRARYRMVVRNTGDVPSRKIELCVGRPPERRVRILGKRCVARGIPPGEARRRVVRVRIRPAARGKLTRIPLSAGGRYAHGGETVARLRVSR